MAGSHLRDAAPDRVPSLIGSTAGNNSSKIVQAEGSCLSVYIPREYVDGSACTCFSGKYSYHWRERRLLAWLEEEAHVTQYLPEEDVWLGEMGRCLSHTQRRVIHTRHACVCPPPPSTCRSCPFRHPALPRLMIIPPHDTRSSPSIPIYFCPMPFYSILFSPLSSPTYSLFYPSPSPLRPCPCGSSRPWML